MRKITLIIIHCSATCEGHDYTVDDIDRWHRERHFASIGYHYVVHLDGTVHKGRPIEQPGAHCLNHNAHSIGICYIGGLDAEGKPKDTRTEAQRQSLRQLIASLHSQFPRAVTAGHNVFSPKRCPCFDAVGEYREFQPH